MASSLALGLGACVGLDLNLSGHAPPHVMLSLRDAGLAAVAPRAEALVPALLLQAQPADSVADTLSLAYSRRAGEYSFYQLATWTERPVRQVPRLLQRRLQARGLAQAVGLVGEPMHADWLVGVGVDAIHHDISASPGTARLAITVDLFDRRTRERVARRQIEVSAPVASADSAAAARGLSDALSQAFDQLLPWLEQALQQASQRPH